MFLKGKKTEVKSVKETTDLNSQSFAEKVGVEKKKRYVAEYSYVRSLGQSSRLLWKEMS